MQHLDEGTIHAWLDGELGAAESASLEAHLGGCDACAALVAEARGLTAAASRILGALDDVPSGVVPAAQPPGAVTPEVLAAASSEVVDLSAQRSERDAKARAAAPRRWFNPRYAAAAAVLVVAIGTYTVSQRSMREPSFSTTAMPEAASVAVDSAVTQDGVAPVPTAAAPAPEPGPARELAKARVGNAAQAPAPPPTPAPSVLQQERSAVADAGVRRDSMAVDEQRFARAEIAAARPVDTVKQAPPSAPPAVARRQVLAESIVRNEALRLRGEGKAQGDLQSVVVTGTGAAAVRGPVALDKRVYAAGTCVVIERSPLAAQLNVPERVELLDVDGPKVGDRTFKLTRVPGAGANVPQWYWHVATDSVLTLAQIDGQPPTTNSSVTVSNAPGQGGVRGVSARCR